MKKFCVFCNSMIGSMYPFFLNNENLGSSYYLYQLASTGLSENCIPTVTLNKISERGSSDKSGIFYGATENGMWSSDILSVIRGTRREIEKRGAELVGKILLDRVSTLIYPNGTEFPLIEMRGSNNIQKLLVIGLRDMNRWKNYKFAVGNCVDVLCSKDRFIVYQINGENSELRLSPKSMYKIDDCNLNNPMPIPENINQGLLGKVWKGDRKASDINRDIRKAEWDYFDKI